MSLSDESGRVKTFQAFPSPSSPLAPVNTARGVRAMTTAKSRARYQSSSSRAMPFKWSAKLVFLPGPRYNAMGLNKLSSSPPRFSLRRRDFSPPPRFSPAIFTIRMVNGIDDSTSVPPFPRYSTTNLGKRRRERERGCVCHLSAAETIKMFRAIGEKGLVGGRNSSETKFLLSEGPTPLEEEEVKRIDSGRPINSSHSANNVVR